MAPATQTQPKPKPASKAASVDGLHATVDRKALTEILAEVSRSSPAKSTLPSLSHFLLEATTSSHLTIAATDLSRRVSAELDATVSTTGAITLPARTLADWVKIQDQGNTVSFQPESTAKYLVSCGRASVKLPFLHAGDWPSMAGQFDDQPSVEFSLGGQELKEAINLVSICAAPDDTRPILHGILLKLADDGKSLTFAAADGFRLAVRTLSFDTAVAQAGVKVVVPVTSADELAHLIGDEDGPVHITLDAAARYVRFAGPVYSLVSNTIEGSFPDYERIIPAEFATVIQASRQPLLRGTRAALLVAGDHAVRFTRSDTLDPTVVITSTAAEGEALDEAQATFADPGSGPAVDTISVNGKYLVEMLRAMPTDTVQWQLKGSMHPLVIRPVGANGYLQVLMPMSSKAT